MRFYKEKDDIYSSKTEQTRLFTNHNQERYFFFLVIPSGHLKEDKEM